MRSGFFVREVALLFTFLDKWVRMGQKEEFAMAMFDDPNKELNRLQNELLSDDFEKELAGLDDLLKDYEPTDMDDFFMEKPKADEDFKRPNAKKDLTEAMSEMLLDEEEELEEAPKPKKEKGIGGLVALCVAETLAILGLLAWWFLCLR